MIAATSLAVLAAHAWGQPPLPPSARSHDVGLVLDIKQGESIRLYTGVRALLGEGAKVTGPFDSVLEGDLVELAYDSEGVVNQISILPRRPQLQPLTELRVESGAAYQTYSGRDGEAYPNGLRSADVQFRLSGAALQLMGVAVHEELDEAQPPATFRILDHAGNVLWEQQLPQGRRAAFRCSLRGASRLRLICTGPIDEPVSPRACVWLSPVLLLREMEYVPLRPELGVALVRGLAEHIGKLEPGTVAIGMPEVIGLSDQMARDLRDDLFVAAADRFRVVGALSGATTWPPSDKERAAAEAMGATSILASRIEYRGARTHIRSALLTVAHNEELAAAEAVIE